MKASPCPTPTEFIQYEQGHLDERDAERIRQHLNSCPTCRTSHQHRPASARIPALPATVIESRQLLMALDRDGLDGSSAVSPAAVNTSVVASDSRHLPRIDGYRITGVLGQGGMGIVYRAVQTKLNRAVALKVLPAMVGSASPTAVARFRREAIAAARLHHTNIVPIYDSGESPDAYYYAMELIDGEPLNALLPRFAKAHIATVAPDHLADVIRAGTAGMLPGPVPSEPQSASDGAPVSRVTASTTGRGPAYYQQVAWWVADVADALQYAHAEGIIHRDIKPGNLILSINGRIMITDFGLAKSTDEESVTMTGSLLGTVRYLSPEQAMAKRIPVDHRTDIYSLGATLYELLCFQPAFPGSDDKQVLAAIITRDPTWPRKIVSSVPEELETICLKTLEKSPDARYATGRDLAEDLRRYIRDMPIVAKRPGLIARARKFVRRHRPAVLAAAALLLLGAMIPVVVRLSRAQEQEERRRIDAEREQEEEERKRIAGDWVNEASFSENNRQWLKAADHYERALRVDPDNLVALSNFARVKKELYNLDPHAPRSLLEEAVELCNQALSIVPNTADLWNLKGVLLKKLEQYGEAIAAYERALKLTPDSWSALENLGMVHALDRNRAKAREYIGRSAEFAGTDPFGCESPWRNLAALHLHLGRPEAIAHLDQAFTCKGIDPASFRLRARLYLELAGHIDVDRALEDADDADLLAEGRDPKVKRVCAQANLRSEKFEEAVTYARAAIDLGDELPAADYLIIAIAEAGLGHLDLARTAYGQASDSWPDELRDEGSYTVTADAGVLWFESADELMRLREQAETLLNSDSIRP